MLKTRKRTLSPTKIILHGLLYVVLVVGAAIMVMPFLWMLSTSLKIDSEIFGRTIRWLPTTFDFSNYKDAFSQTNMGRLYFNTFLVTLISVVSQLLLCSMAGYAFARLNFWGKNVLFFTLLATMMVPLEALIIPVFLFVRAFPLVGGNDIFGQGGTGLMNSYAGLVFPHIVSVFGLFLFRQFYLRFPLEIEEAAIVDGCTRLGIYWRILLPNSKPVLGTMALFAFLWSWNDFLWPLVVVKDDRLKTLQLGLSLFNQEQGTRWAELMAASVMVLVPVIVLYLFLQRFLVNSNVTSGIK